MWADVVDRIKANHPNASVKTAGDGDRLEVAMGDLTIFAIKVGRRFTVGKTYHSNGITDTGTVTVDSAQDAYYVILEELNRIWSASQKPRTSSGGAASSGCGVGDGDDLVVGGSVEVYEPLDDDD